MAIESSIAACLNRVYWILGKSCGGKTTAADFLAEKYSMFPYHGDEMRAKHFRTADPKKQPALCRDVPDMLALPLDAIRQWEEDIVQEMTPMILQDLARLSSRYPSLVFEGDLCLEEVVPFLPPDRVFYLSADHKLIKRDFFSRPDHRHMLQEIENMELSREEKEKRIHKYYDLISQEGQPPLPSLISEYGIPYYIRTEHSTVEEMMNRIEKRFGLA